MTLPGKHFLAQGIIACMVSGLFCWGLRMLTIPKIFFLASPFLRYEGPVLIATAVILAWFHDWVADKLIWLSEEIHRWISTLLMVGVIGAEGFMHLFNIPHLEGWWISLLGGGAAATVLATGLQRWKSNVLQAMGAHEELFRNMLNRAIVFCYRK